MNCDDVVPNPSEREARLQRIRRLGGLSGIQDLKEGLPRAHGESQPLLKIGHARKCDGVMLRDLYQIMIGREDADPA
jgi:hypothetical protein